VSYSNVVSVKVTQESDYVGVLSGSATCPSGVPTVSFFMDTVDNGLDSAAVGWTGASWVDGRNYVNLNFCRVDGKKFLPLTSTPDQTKEYAVLKLGSRCPAGSVEFGRMFDNEDSGNLNRNSGNIAPSYQDVNTMMKFCLFRYAASGAPIMQPNPNTGTMFPPLGFAYGVFAAPAFYYTVSGASGMIVTDDENDNTASYFSIPSTLDVTSVYRIIDGYPHSGANTTMNTALVSYE
jgi:hypothetical protein